MHPYLGILDQPLFCKIPPAYCCKKGVGTLVAEFHPWELIREFDKITTSSKVCAGGSFFLITLLQLDSELTGLTQ